MFNLAPVDAVPHYIAKDVEDAGSWLIKKVPEKNDEEVTFVVSLENRKIAVQLSTKKSFDHLNLPPKMKEEIIQHLDPKLAETVNPKLECLTADKRTRDMAEEIGMYIFKNLHQLYNGATLDTHRVKVNGLVIGQISL